MIYIDIFYFSKQGVRILVADSNYLFIGQIETKMGLSFLAE